MGSYLAVDFWGWEIKIGKRPSGKAGYRMVRVPKGSCKGPRVLLDSECSLVYSNDAVVIVLSSSHLGAGRNRWQTWSISGSSGWGVDAWNRWRKERYSKVVDLRDTSLWGAGLREANLRGANLWWANLKGAMAVRGSAEHDHAHGLNARPGGVEDRRPFGPGPLPREELTARASEWRWQAPGAPSRSAQRERRHARPGPGTGSAE